MNKNKYRLGLSGKVIHIRKCVYVAYVQKFLTG